MAKTRRCSPVPLGHIRLWGRAVGVRTLLRTAAQSLAPLLFGGVPDHVFGGGHTGLGWSWLRCIGGSGSLA
jgi:hypothetical protein